MIKVGLIGMGRVAEGCHIPQIKKVEGFELACICDISKERREFAEREYHVQTCSEYDTLLDSDIDLIVITTPSNTHKELTIKALKRGKHVIVDKPIALNLKDTDDMINYARKRSKLLSVYQSRRWDGDFLTVKKILKHGLLGKVFSIESNIMHFGSPAWTKVPGIKDWAWRLKKSFGGGMMFDWGPHMIDQALLLINSRPKGVWCDMKSAFWTKEVDDYFRCIILFENDLTFQLQFSSISRYPLPRWYITGDKGTLVCDGWNGPLKIKGIFHGAECELIPKMEPSNWEFFYENIYGAITKKLEPAVKLEEVHKAMAVIEAAIKSDKTGKVVEV